MMWRQPSCSYLDLELAPWTAMCKPGPRHQILLFLRAGPVSLHFYA